MTGSAKEIIRPGTPGQPGAERPRTQGMPAGPVGETLMGLPAKVPGQEVVLLQIPGVKTIEAAVLLPTGKSPHEPIAHVELPHTAASVPAARVLNRSAMGLLAGAEGTPDELRRIAQGQGSITDLVISELVANSVEHNPGKENVVVDLSKVTDEKGHDRLRISVGNPGEGDVRMQAAAPGDERGRGLLLVDAVSDRWGFMKGGGRTVVWADIGLPLAS
jgi:hypothetical protein